MAKSGYKQPNTLDEAVKVMTPVVRKFARKYTRNHYHIYEAVSYTHLTLPTKA